MSLRYGKVNKHANFRKDRAKNVPVPCGSNMKFRKNRVFVLKQGYELRTYLLKYLGSYVLRYNTFLSFFTKVWSPAVKKVKQLHTFLTPDMIDTSVN